MKRIVFAALVLSLSLGLLAGQASALESLFAEKAITEGTPRRGPGGPGRPGGGNWNRPPPHRPGRPGHHGGSGWGWALGAAVGSAIGSAVRPSYPSYSYRPAQPTLVCDAYGNCYYQNY